MRYQINVWRGSVGSELLKRLMKCSSTDRYLARTDSRAAAKIASASPRVLSSAQARPLAITFVSPLILAHSSVCTAADGVWKPMFLHSALWTSLPISVAGASVGVCDGKVSGLLATSSV